MGGLRQKTNLGTVVSFKIDSVTRSNNRKERGRWGLILNVVVGHMHKWVLEEGKNEKMLCGREAQQRVSNL